VIRSHRASRLGRLYIVAPAAALLLLVAAPGFSDSEGGVPQVRFPQARIDKIDVSAFPKVRVLATLLGKKGVPIEVGAITELDVVDGNKASIDPYAQFKEGLALDGRKDALLRAADKAVVKHAIVFVMLGYQNDALRSGTLGDRVKEAVVPLFKAVAKTDRANIVVYSDRLYSFMQLKGKASKLADIEFLRTACADARDEALTGGAITLGDKAAEHAPGTDLCGLTADAKSIAKLIENQAFQGFFPRLFNLGRPFHDPKRYCMPPKEALKIWGQFTPANNEANNERIQTEKDAGRAVPWDTSAFDEALRLLLRDGKDDEEKIVVFISDGADGYRDELTLCRASPPKIGDRNCGSLSGNRRGDCIRTYVKNKRKARQAEFAKRSTHWIGVARASGVRVFSLGLGMLGRPYELQRLQLLSAKTGGTYRQADLEGQLAERVDEMAKEMFGQVVIDFEVQHPEELEEKLSLKLKMKLNRADSGGVSRLKTLPVTVLLPEHRGLLSRGKDFGIDILVSAQEALGYERYVIIGIIVLVFAILLFLIIGFFVSRFFFRLVGRLFGSKEEDS
jgi:hypothetical protein